MSDETKAVAGLILACFLAVLLVRLAVSTWTRRRQSHKLTRREQNLIRFEPTSKRRPVSWRALRLPRLSRLNPLWLVALAVTLLIYWNVPELQVFGSLEVLAGPVTHVRDGDTIEVAGRPIRLNGLHCDEKGNAPR